MSIDADDEILQDFLVEAGEILERLNEELVELEQSPDDTDLLNAVFRSFHTIKGGASFLSLDGLVDVCHRAEDVFNVLRNGERSVDTDLMDTVLQVLDVVNSMFAEIQGGEMPTPADPALLKERQTEQLKRLVAHACETTTHYRQFSGATKLQDFPVLQKRAIREHHDDFISSLYRPDSCVVRKTSGSYGTPLAFYHT